MELNEIKKKNEYYSRVIGELLTTRKAKINIDEIVFRASSVGDLCGAKGLGKTGEKRARYTYLEHTTGRKKEFTSKQTDKGNLTEGVSIAEISEQLGRELTKNEVRLYDEYFTGECDIDDEADDCIIDVKASWDVFTHDDNKAAYNKDHEDQLRVYMRLYKRKKAKLIYKLIDAPDEMVLKAIESENYKWPGLETPEWRQVEILINMVYTRESFDRLVLNLGLGGDPLTDRLIDLFVEIPIEDRTKVYEFTHDQPKEDFIISRVVMARDYLKIHHNAKN